MKVDILIQPGKQSRHTERVLKAAAKTLGITLQISYTSNFGAYSHLSVNPSQTPIVIISGNVEFAGGMPDANMVQKRLSELAFQA